MRKPIPEYSALLSVEQVATMLQVSPRTVWRLLSSGELIEPVRIRGNTRWRRDELDAWINDGCPPAYQTFEK